jgi:hypothetical protein
MTMLSVSIELKRELITDRVDAIEEAYNGIRNALDAKIAEVEGRLEEPEPAVAVEIDKCRALVADVRALLAEARARLASVGAGQAQV